MKKNTKHRKSKALRNALIVLAAAVLTVAAVELLLGAQQRQRNDASSIALYEAQKEENDEILKMDMEKAGYADLFASTVFGNIVSDLTPPEGQKRMTAAEYAGYPLIAGMQDESEYDENTVNIVVIGDSFVWGQSSLNRNEIFWRLLETNLRAQGYNVRVYGVAIIGANAYDELKWLTESSLVEDLRPDLIVFGYLYNDPDDSSTEDEILRGASYVDGAKNKLVAAISKLLPNIGERLANFVTAKTMYTADGTYVRLNSVPPILKGEILEKFRTGFIEPLDAFSARTQIPVALMTLPIYQGKLIQKALYEPLHTLCGACGHVALYDSVDAFYGSFVSAKHKANYSVNSADFHPGSATNYFYASYFEEFLKRDYSALLGSPAETVADAAEPAINDATPKGVSPVLMRREAGECVYELNYPSKTAAHDVFGTPFRRYYLTLPLEKDFIALSLAEPTDLSRIEVTGDGADDIEVYYMRINEALGYDDHTVLPFVRQGGAWIDETEDRVTTLFIHADCKNDGGARLTLRMK